MRILRGLTSRLLPCGCVAGIYETYDGEVVTLVDERSGVCSDANHQNGNRIPERSSSGTIHAPTPVGRTFTRRPNSRVSALAATRDSSA